ncbi:hypothetical protein L1887_62783 [Cichorium endivia]|nr:hypothetical protein L1887_62783 [Cichorium endivia]
MAVVTKTFGLGGHSLPCGGRDARWVGAAMRGCQSQQQASAWGRTSGQKKRPPTFARPILPGCMTVTARNGLRGQAPDESFGEIPKKSTEKDGSIQRHRRCPEVDFRAADEPLACSPQPVPPTSLASLASHWHACPHKQLRPHRCVILCPGASSSQPSTARLLLVRCCASVGPCRARSRGRVRRASQPLRALNGLSCFRGAVDCRSWRHHRQPCVWLWFLSLATAVICVCWTRAE